ncbi:hypothetical protein [Falsiroseomonas sp.]|uniref:hypothetical protein n=1 Tax=Falsiroseomonas sp. TaxID=2870721 RepID=UPI0034A45667
MRAAFVLGVALAAAPAAAQQPEPLLEDPVGLTGVEPVSPGSYTITFSGSWERARSGRRPNTYGGGIEAEIGLVRGLDLLIQQLGSYGRAAPYGDETTAPNWGGESQAGLRWQLLEEGDWTPSFGVFGAVGTAYGQSRPATDLGALALFGKTLLGGARPVALLLNAGWTQRLDPEPGERAGRYLFAGGLAHSISQDSSVALSVERQQQDHGEQDQTLVQAGLSHQLGGGGPILGLGAGFGIGRDSPSFVLGLTAIWTIGD